MQFTEADLTLARDVLSGFCVTHIVEPEEGLEFISAVIHGDEEDVPFSILKETEGGYVGFNPINGSGKVIGGLEEVCESLAAAA